MFKYQNFWWLGALLFFSVLTYNLLAPAKLSLYFEANGWALKTHSKQVLVSHAAFVDRAKSHLLPWQYKTFDVFLINDLEIGQSWLLDEEIKVHRIGHSSWKIETADLTWIYFDDEFHHFPVEAKVSSKSDFWIMNQSAQVPTSVSSPSKGILLLHSKPKKALADYAEAQGIKMTAHPKNTASTIKKMKDGWYIKGASYNDKNN